jgi:hypothetical protein
VPCRTASEDPNPTEAPARRRRDAWRASVFYRFHRRYGAYWQLSFSSPRLENTNILVKVNLWLIDSMIARRWRFFDRLLCYILRCNYMEPLWSATRSGKTMPYRASRAASRSSEEERAAAAGHGRTHAPVAWFYTCSRADFWGCGLGKWRRHDNTEIWNLIILCSVGVFCWIGGHENDEPCTQRHDLIICLYVCGFVYSHFTACTSAWMNNASKKSVRSRKKMSLRIPKWKY